MLERLVCVDADSSCVWTSKNQDGIADNRKIREYPRTANTVHKHFFSLKNLLLLLLLFLFLQVHRLSRRLISPLTRLFVRAEHVSSSQANATCNSQLELPAVHFLCTHSFHQRCLIDNEKVRSKAC